MIDFKDLQANPEKYRTAVEQKNKKVDIDKVLELGSKRLELLQKTEEIRAEINTNSDKIKTEVAEGGKPSHELIDKGKSLKTDLQELEEEMKSVEEEFTPLLYSIPNPPTEDTPVGKDENDNVVVKTWGTPRNFEEEGFKPLDHQDLGEKLGLIDKERAAKISGSRFTYLLGDIARMQFAILQMVFEKLSDGEFVKELIEEKNLNITPTPFKAIVPPVIVNTDTLARMNRLEPKEDRFGIDLDDQYLVGSAEHSIGPMYMDEIIPAEELPIRYIGYSSSFRREAGSYGKDTRGILRLHQFDKLEMEIFSDKETSMEEQELMVGIQEKLVQMLELPYQLMAICTGDMGGPDARQFDINCWMPGQNTYRETHTSDLMTDYQSRRLNTRYEDEDGEKQFVHMNDATAFAIGRILVAIMENYQTKDGKIEIPTVLQGYMGGQKIIG